eukprot:3515980-Amphidinium_carterae.1
MILSQAKKCATICFVRNFSNYPSTTSASKTIPQNHPCQNLKRKAKRGYCSTANHLRHVSSLSQHWIVKAVTLEGFLAV